MPRPAGPGRTRPVWARRVSSGSAAMEPTGPVQLTTAADAEVGAVVEGDVEGVVAGADGGDGAAVALEPALVGDGVEAACGGGRHPVPVDVPACGRPRR